MTMEERNANGGDGPPNEISPSPLLRPGAPTRKIIYPQSQVDQFAAVLERKNSMARILQQTAADLSQSHYRKDTRGPEDVIYDLFKLPNKEEASIGKLLMVLKSYGLEQSDPRLRPMMDKVTELEQRSEQTAKEARGQKYWRLTKEDFRACIGKSMSVITRTIQNNLVIPAWQQFTGVMQELYEKCSAEVTHGKVASYIPQLARVPPDMWGVSICTVDGQRCAFGNTHEPFCFQSVSKAFTYAIAASDMGADVVHSYVGQEPSGRLCNEICLDSKNKPHNPMINSGAILVTSLIQNKLNLADRFDYVGVLKRYKQIAGGQYIGFNNAVFLSERKAADRNYALAYYMKENKCFSEATNNLTDALDFYFQLCSLEGNCESLAVMAATLANGGVCPLTEERCIESRPCRDVLSLMYSCGMYDYSGQFAFHIGLPAKSGASGAMIVVVPNVMGICLWSPPLDAMGNSCKGVAFCKHMIAHFNFHNYDSLVHNDDAEHEGTRPKFDPRKRFSEMERDQVVSLLFAAKCGDLNTIRSIYMQGGDLEMSDYDKRTALHVAASEGQFETVRFLVNIGRVRVDPRDRWNKVPREDAHTFGYPLIEAFLERAEMLSSSSHSFGNSREVVPEFWSWTPTKPIETGGSNAHQEKEEKSPAAAFQLSDSCPQYKPLSDYSTADSQSRRDQGLQPHMEGGNVGVDHHGDKSRHRVEFMFAGMETTGGKNKITYQELIPQET